MVSPYRAPVTSHTEPQGTTPASCMTLGGSTTMQSFCEVGASKKADLTSRVRASHPSMAAFRNRALT